MWLIFIPNSRQNKISLHCSASLFCVLCISFLSIIFAVAVLRVVGRPLQGVMGEGMIVEGCWGRGCNSSYGVVMWQYIVRNNWQLYM